LEAGQHVLDECAAANLDGPGRPQHTVKELTDGDDTDRAIFVPEMGVDLRRLRAAFKIDQ